MTRRILINAADSRLKIVHAEYSDLHFVELELNESLEATVCAHSLPDIEYLFKPVGTVDFHTNTFFTLLSQMESFYTQINVIDELCDVVDPVEYSTKCDYRVFRLGKRADAGSAETQVDQTPFQIIAFI